MSLYDNLELKNNFIATKYQWITLRKNRFEY